MAKKKSEDLIQESIDNSSLFNPLLTALKANDKKNLFQSNVTTFFHRTGYPLFDYYFGAVINIHNELGEIINQIPRLGQASGSFNQIVGMSSSGKTTLAIQLAANIIRPHKNANIIHYDCEQRMDLTRIENISRLHPSDFESNKYILKGGQVGLDTIQEMIVKTWATKMKMKDDLTYNTKELNEFGKEIYVLEPTVIIIDSVSQVISETYSPENTKDVDDAEKLQSNTEGARNAKSLKGFFRDVLPLCKEANIIIYGINHLNDNMSMNIMSGPRRQQNFLRVDESIPGGRNILYNSFNIAKLVAKPGDNFTLETDGFEGHMVMIEPIKSSSNQSGNDAKGVSFEMVFNFKYGFDSLRSLILYGRDKGVIIGNKPKMKFVGDDSFTFAFKNLDNEINEKPIWESIRKFVYPELNSHLPYIEPDRIKFDMRSLEY